jgi:hypothetical protein
MHISFVLLYRVLLLLLSSYLKTKHVEIAGRLRATQEAKRIATKACAAQKKQAVADGPGPGPIRQTRLEIEEAIPTEIPIPHLPSRAEMSNLPDADKKRAAVEVLGPDPKQKKLRTGPTDVGGQAFRWI